MRMLIIVVAAIGAGLLSAGPAADPNADLFRSIRAGDIPRAPELLRNGVNVNAREPHGATPLMYGAQYSTAACMKLLLEHDAEVNAKNQFGATALMWGADDIAKVRLLIAAGAEVNARANSGRTALMAAASTVGAA